MLRVIGHNLRSYFITGLLVVLPVIVSLEVFFWFLRFLDDILKPTLSRFMGVYVFGFGIVLMLCLIVLVGIGARNYAGKKLVDLVEFVFDRLPFIRVIYSAVKQLLEPFNTEQGYSLKQVVLIEYPMKDRLCVGFLAKDNAGDRNGDRLVTVFIPSNHLHLGYLVILPEKDVIRIDMSVEEALKMAVSCGIVVPRPIRVTDTVSISNISPASHLPTQPVIEGTIGKRTRGTVSPKSRRQ